MIGVNDEKIERFENFYERALNRSDEMEEKILQKRENVIARHKVLAGKSDEELEVILEGIESEEGLTDARKSRVERVEQRDERFFAVHEIRLENARVRLNDSDLSDEQKAMVQLKLGKLDEKLDTFREKSVERIEIAKGKLREVEVSEEIKVGISEVVVESQ